MSIVFAQHNLKKEKWERKKNRQRKKRKEKHFSNDDNSISIQRLAKSRMRYALTARQYSFGVWFNN